MWLVSFTLDFRIKDTPGTEFPVLFNAFCYLRGDKQIAHCNIDPETLYAPVVRHETIRMLLAKVEAQDLILEGVNVSSAYLHGEMKTPVILQLPTDFSSIPWKPIHATLVIKYICDHREAGNIW